MPEKATLTSTTSSPATTLTTTTSSPATTLTSTQPPIRGIKPGIITLTDLHGDGLVRYENGKAVITVAKVDDAGNICTIATTDDAGNVSTELLLADVIVTALVGLTPSNIATFVNRSDPAAKDLSKMRAAIRQLRDGGLTDSYETAKANFETKFGVPFEN